MTILGCNHNNDAENTWQQEYKLFLDSCQRYERQIKYARQIATTQAVDTFDFCVNAKEQWKHYAIAGLNLARGRNNNYWKCIFVEQLYDYYMENAWSYDATYRTRQAEKYARQLVVATTDLHNTDSLYTAISHYLHVSMRIAESDTAMNFMYKQVPIFKKELEERAYKKVLCFIARQLAFYNDTINAKKILAKAMGHKLSQNTNEAVELRVVHALWRKHAYKDAANAYLSLLESNEVMHEKENMINKSKTESADIHIRNVYLICILIMILLIGMGLGYFLYHRWETNIHIYSSEIDKMKTDVDYLRTELEETKKSESNNYSKIQVLERRIEQLQKNIMERLRLGEIIYENLEQGEHLPTDLKGSESYLLDYVMIKRQDLYTHWNEKYTKLTPHMYTYLLLVELGKTNEEIEKILCITSSSLRSLRSRLASKERLPEEPHI